MRVIENKSSSDILTSVENGMLKIVINRPKKLNAITKSMYNELSEILQKSIQDNSIYVVVVTGTGRFFTSGNDFGSFLANPDNDLEEIVSKVFRDFINVLITYPKLLIAVVNGPAIGVGLTMLPLFDMVYASDKAYFQAPFTSIGLVAEGCSTYTFPKVFGKSKAGDMLYLGHKLSALEAKQYGLVSELYKSERMDEVWTYLETLSKLSSESILAIKRLVNKWDKNILLEINAQESKELVERIRSPDFTERITKLVSKSKL